MGEAFIHFLKLKACVLINDTSYSEFSLERSTKQGDLSPPLIFALANEPLTEAIRSNNSITGLSTDSIFYKIVLYADDVLVFISKP